MYSLRKIFHPEIFQGSLKRKNYFEGWYFKHVGSGHTDAFAVIPGISLSDDSHAFIQFSDGFSGSSSYYRYGLHEFHAEKDKLLIRIGDSLFSEEGIDLNLKGKGQEISGKIKYSDHALLPSTILSPGIMGWYSFVPGMECNHGVVSMNHKLEGFLKINGNQRIFDGGRGYIEKDWGSSFPESWLWLQSNSFGDHEVSVMVSVAKIPWRGNFFIGFISFLYIDGKTEIFATWNRSKVLVLRMLSISQREIVLSKGKKRIRVLVTVKDSSSLKAPVNGTMVNHIKESLSSEVFLEFAYDKKLIYKGEGVPTGFEETEGIYKYF